MCTLFSLHAGYKGKIIEAVMPGGLGDLGGGALEGLTGGGLGLPSPSTPTPTTPSVGVPF